MTGAALCVALLALGAAGAGAQSSGPFASGRDEPTTTAGASPLERRVTIHVRDVALRDALDRVAVLADIRISYSGDNLPLDRRVTLARDSASVAEVLSELLQPFGVEPRVVAADHIVLVPRPATGIDSARRGVALLDRVVVTGRVLSGPERELPVALDVVPGRQIERRDESTLAEVLSGAVPGVWLWEHTPTSILARYGSIRGASSFGLSFPKVYIDGIEVANPLLLTQITPELVERIEVIRGPQGAALYGSDAISGVVNVVSRHEGAGPDGSRALLRSTMGITASAFTESTVPVQEHALTLRFGSNLRSAGVTVGGSTSGQFIPQGQNRELRGIADARFIGSRATVTANARVHGRTTGIPANPLLAGWDADEIETDDDPQELRMYSLGSTATIAASHVWTYSLTAGIDGYTLENVSIDQSAIPSVADSVLRNASGSALRGTFRASAVSRLGSPDRLGGTLTFALEESMLHDDTGRNRSGDDDDGEGPDGWSSNAGLSVQANLAVRDALFVTTGVRRERLGETSGLSRFATLPMVGVTLTRGGAADWIAVKLRGAYGKGVRGSHSMLHVATREPRRTLPNPQLAPEEQAGVEAGADIVLWRRVGLHLTRFDQLASGLIQTVTINDPSNSGPGSRRSWYQLQNVGEISNRGWETQATFAAGALSLAGAASFVDSRVRRLAVGYTGDLQPGDRMLAVPARTIGGTAAWTGRLVSFSTTLARASDWVNYDRLAIARDLLAADGDATEFTGSGLRRYWINYPGATRLRASVTFGGRGDGRGALRGLLLTVTGENLLNHQRGEPDSITIVPGRTITAGIRARF